jgi:DNA-binding CsgD family transcriptional regulator
LRAARTMRRDRALPAPPSTATIVADTSERIRGLIDRFVTAVFAANLGDVPTPPVRRVRAGQRGRRRGGGDAFTTIDTLALEPAQVRSLVAAVQKERRLSGREAQILAAALCGVPRSQMAASIGVAENSIKTFIRKLLGKLGEKTLDDAVWAVRTRGAGRRGR